MQCKSTRFQFGAATGCRVARGGSLNGADGNGDGEGLTITSAPARPAHDHERAVVEPVAW